MGRRRQAFGALFSFAASRHRTTVRLTGTLRVMGDGGASSTKFAARSCGELCRRRATGLAQMQAFLGNLAGVSGGFPPRSVSPANPSPRASMCLTNKGSPVWLRSRISPHSP